ncbi:glycosyltransferase family 4 protein [candidate division WOR-3 bacterium]|nr:glycosyltransferase family 4 protein [candidate division WOR-3 bacterium]
MSTQVDRPLRICLVSAAYYPYPSGVTEHVHHLACELHRLGHHVHVLTTNFAGPTGPAEPFPVTRFGRALLVPMNRSYATVPVGLRMAGQVKRFMTQGGFDIVHCHGMFWPEISYWAIRYSPARNLVTFLTAGFRIHTRGSGLFQRLFRGHLARIHGRIAISSRARQAVEPYVPGDWRIVPCGIDLERFRPELDRPPSHDLGRPIILFLSRLDGRKGITAMLHAVPSVLRSVPSALLVVVGSGPMDRAARELAARLGIEQSVRFVGRVTAAEAPAHYANCDVYCSPALGGETLGIVLLEAMASGAPVVASRIPGYDETVRDGIDGLLCPAGDSESLARNILAVLTDAGLAGRLRAAGLARVREYAWSTIAQRTLELYRETLTPPDLQPDH